jgi:hypothetical protein
MSVESHDGMIEMGKLVIHPPELSDNVTTSHLIAK